MTRIITCTSTTLSRRIRRPGFTLRSTITPRNPSNRRPAPGFESRPLREDRPSVPGGPSGFPRGMLYRETPAAPLALGDLLARHQQLVASLAALPAWVAACPARWASWGAVSSGLHRSPRARSWRAPWPPERSSPRRPALRAGPTRARGGCAGVGLGQTSTVALDVVLVTGYPRSTAGDLSIIDILVAEIQ